MIGTVIELGLTFLQFLSALASIPNIDLPDAWASPLYYVKIVNLDIPVFRELFPALDDFRVYFTVICVIIPLGLVFFGLFFLNSVGILLWYLLLLSGFCLAVAGVLSKNLRDTLQLDVEDETADAMITVGFVLFVGSVVFALIYIGWKKRQNALAEAEAKNEEADTCNHDGGGIARTEVESLMHHETRDFPVLATIQRTVMLLVFGVVGLLLVEVYVEFSIGNGFDSVQFGLGITFLLLSLFTFIWTIMGCIQKGRQLQWKFFAGMERRFMFLLLITMSMLYIPVGAGLFVLFNCNTQSCATGEQIIREGSWLPHNNTPDTATGTTDLCIPCNQPSPQRCTDVSYACGVAESQDRLEADKFIDCDDLVIFNYAAIIIIGMYMIGVPVMFWKLVNLVTGLVLNDFPVKCPKGVDPDDNEALWEIKVAQSQNSARFLYHPFVPIYRYTRLFQLVQKLLVVFTAVFVIRTGSVSPIWFALVAGVAIHIISLAWLAYARPFQHKFENGIALLMELALIGSMACAILLLMEVEVPDEALWTIILLNGVLPIAAVVISIVLEWSRQKSDEDKEREEQQAAFEEEMAKREQEDTDREMAQQLHDQERYPNQAPGSPQESSYSPNASGMIGSMTQSTSQRPNGDKLLAKDATKVALARTRAKEAREAAEKKREAEAMTLLGQQNDVDFAINRTVKRQLNLFLMGGGALGFVALGLCIVGLLATVGSAPTRWDTEYKTTETELGGYSSWPEFTAACCCRSNWGDPERTDALIVEQWRCANGFVKEKPRMTYVVDPTGAAEARMRIDGLAIRPECGTSFNDGCLLMTGGVGSDATSGDAADVSVQAFCSDIVNTTGYAVQYLW